MRQRLLTIFALLPFAAAAQTVATFETPALPKADTFFIRYDVSKTTDVGLNSGLAHFPLYVDSQYKSFNGFTYSNMTDSLSGGYGNQYSARSGKGVNGSAQYAVAYGDTNKVILVGAAKGKSVKGFYITNNSYAYYDMKYGTPPFSKKFGDTTGTNSGLPQGSFPDYFKVVIRGYSGGVLKPDTVEAYLADYRFADSTQDYILKDWRWVSLLKLGGVDSLHFRMYSSDTGTYGINTPLYFCMDDFTTNESVGVGNEMSALAAKVYPNPATQTLYVELAEGETQEILLFDMSGKLLQSKPVHSAKEEMSIGLLPSGNYMLQLRNAAGQTASQRIIKQ